MLEAVMVRWEVGQDWHWNGSAEDCIHFARRHRHYNKEDELMALLVGKFEGWKINLNFIVPL